MLVWLSSQMSLSESPPGRPDAVVCVAAFLAQTSLDTETCACVRDKSRVSHSLGEQSRAESR